MKNNIRPLAATLVVLLGSAAFGADNNRFTQIDYPGGSATQAWGINSRGDIVGFYTGADKNNHGFLTNGGKFTPIDYPGAAVTFAKGINAQGDMVGEFGETATSRHHGFRLGSDASTPSSTLRARPRRCSRKSIRAAISLACILSPTARGIPSY